MLDDLKEIVRPIREEVIKNGSSDFSVQQNRVNTLKIL
jgi:hypothetical protein